MVQVACGQHFTLCLTLNGKIVIWGSISGKTTNDDGFFYQRPEYIFFSSLEMIEIFFSNRYLGGFSEKRMIQIAAGYSHCLGLTDVSFFSELVSFFIFLFVGWNSLCNRN